MARVSRGVTAHARHKKVIKAAKGYYGRRKNTFKTAKQAVIKRVNMHIVTGVCASANFGPCGSNGLMRLPVCME